MKPSGSASYSDEPGYRFPTSLYVLILRTVMTSPTTGSTLLLKFLSMNTDYLLGSSLSVDCSTTEGASRIVSYELYTTEKASLEEGVWALATDIVSPAATSLER
jgi:hypothetical protein